MWEFVALIAILLLFALIVGMVIWKFVYDPFFAWVGTLPEEEQEQVLRDFNIELTKHNYNNLGV